MTKLSRMDKYKELRSQIDESQAEPKKEEPAAAVHSTSTRLAAPDAKRAARSDVPVHPATPVIEGVLGEVKQYNLENGDLVTDDTQMQILYDLSEDRDPAERRRKHLETMEANEAAGGTTLNIYASSLEAVSEANKNAVKNATKPEELRVSLESKALLADDAAEDDQLDLIAFNKGDKNPQTEVEPSPSKARHDERKAARKKEREANDARAKAKAKARAEKKAVDEKRRQAEQLAAPQQPASISKTAAVKQEPAKDMREEPEEKKSNGANIVIGLFIVILIAAIGACVYLMKKLGIF